MAEATVNHKNHTTKQRTHSKTNMTNHTEHKQLKQRGFDNSLSTPPESVGLQSVQHQIQSTRQENSNSNRNAKHHQLSSNNCEIKPNNSHSSSNPHSPSQTSNTPTATTSSTGSNSPRSENFQQTNNVNYTFPTSPMLTNPINQLPRSPSPRYRHHSEASSPNTRSPSPQSTPGQFRLLTSDGDTATQSIGDDSGTGGGCSGFSDSADFKLERKPKSVSFHSHTNWKSVR